MVRKYIHLHLELVVISFVLEMCCSWWNSLWNRLLFFCMLNNVILKNICYKHFIYENVICWNYIFILLADVARARCINQAVGYLIIFVVVKIPQFSGKIWLHTPNYDLVFILQNLVWILNRFQNCHIFINILILQSKTWVLDVYPVNFSITSSSVNLFHVKERCEADLLFTLIVSFQKDGLSCKYRTRK